MYLPSISRLFISILLYHDVTAKLYCSEPSAMQSRGIPPISDDSQLIQAIVVIRHGARTPYTPLKCWNGYNTRWDCNLTTDMLVPDKPVVFEKRYDGLMQDPDSQNGLGGTCLTGQLIEQGVKQELVNGIHLRNAYGGVLFNSTKDIYLRSDDEQRTLVSLQVLVGGLLDGNATTPLTIHTADYSRDIIAPHANQCPRLHELSLEAYQSKEYHSHLFSPDIQRALSSVQQEWPQKHMNDGLDCLMTTYCTNRPLPKWLESNQNGYTDDDGSLFTDLANFFAWNYSFQFSYNEGSYGKLAMTPLWNWIIPQLPIINTNSSKPKILLISGHDTTLIALLTSLQIWDGKWPPYASMFVIETYLTSTNQIAFRLVYNGQVITPMMESCPDAELCDMKVLVNHLDSFLANEWDCKLRLRNSVTTKTVSISTVWIACLSTAMLTAFFTYYYLVGQQQQPFQGYYTRVPNSDHTVDSTAIEIADTLDNYGSTHSSANEV